jgi:hypothetical protein
MPQWTKYQTSMLATLDLRDSCAPIFRPLFEHMICLAQDSHKNGHYIRAGRELRHARKVAGWPVCAQCGQPITDGTSTCSADVSHAAIAA